MPRQLATWIMRSRAKRIYSKLKDVLPASSEVILADIGSGTGHNAEYLRTLSLHVDQFDVSDLHWVGESPHLITNGKLDAKNEVYATSLLLHVLQYSTHPNDLLRESARVSEGTVIVMQSTYAGKLSKAFLFVREFLYGKLGFYAARFVGLVPAQHCSLSPQHYFTHEKLLSEFSTADLLVMTHRRQRSIFANVYENIFVLAKHANTGTIDNES